MKTYVKTNRFCGQFCSFPALVPPAGFEAPQRASGSRIWYVNSWNWEKARRYGPVLVDMYTVFEDLEPFLRDLGPALKNLNPVLEDLEPVLEVLDSAKFGLLELLGLGFEVSGQGFDDLGLGFEVMQLGFEVLGLGFDVSGRPGFEACWARCVSLLKPPGLDQGIGLRAKTAKILLNMAK